VDLVINPDNTKYMRFSASPSRRSLKGATINVVTYEGVAEFIYLDTLINNDNGVEKEIQRRILPGGRTYCAVINVFRSRLLFRATKIMLYKTLIRPVASYGAEAWTLTKKEQALLIFERKIFRRMYGPKCGPRSSVGVATGYGLDGPGSNPDEDEFFSPTGPGAQQASCKMGTGSFPG